MKFAVFAKINKILELTNVSLKRFQKTFLKHKWCVLSQFSLKEQILRIKFKNLLATRQIFADKSLFTWNFKGARKLSFTHYLFAVFILFNTGLCKSAFSTNSFRKLVFLSFCAFCLFCLLWVEFDVIFINFITFAQSLFIQVPHNLCFCSHLWETVC